LKSISFKKRWSPSCLLKWICVTFTLLPLICQAQPALDKIQFNHFSIDHGLSQTVFTSTLQDRKGYMWFGSINGLIKFDGYKFTEYNYVPNDKKSLPANDVKKLCEDSSGNIWMAAESSHVLSKFDPHTESFSVFQKNEKNQSEGLPGFVQSMVTDKQGKVWIGTGQGLCFYDAASGKIIHLDKIIFPDTLCSRNIYCLMIDHTGFLWIGTANGINVYDPLHKRIKLFDPRDKNYAGFSKEVQCILEDHSGNIWIGTQSEDVTKRGLYCYTPAKGTSKLYTHAANSNSIGPGFINTLVEDRYNNIWVGMYEGGISIYQSRTDNFINYRGDASDRYSLSSDHVMSIFEDRSGVTWIGTNGGGLNTCYLAPKKLDVYQNYDKEFTTHYPLSLYKNRHGKIYLTTFGTGVSEFDPAKGSFIPYKYDKSDKESIYCYNAFEDSGENLWSASFNEGLHKLDRKTGKFITIHSIKDNADTTFHNISNCIAEDQNKRLWIGTNKGLKCYNLKEKKYSAAEDLFRDASLLSSATIVSLYCDNDGILWISGDNGLTLFNTKSGQIKNFRHDDRNPNSLSDDHVTSFYDDGYNKLWIGTEGGGLNEFDKKTEQFVAFTTKAGMPDNSIYGILADNSGNLWLETNKGICKFTPPSAKNNKPVFRIYNMSDGLPGCEFYYNTCAKANDGTFYFASKKGLIAFKPEELKDNPNIPAVAITSLNVFNKTILSDDSTGILKCPIDETKKIKLSYQQNNLTFSFAALNYVRPEKNSYAYKLEGYDKDWIYTDANKRFASYTNLDAGEYTFKVKASNNDNVWNEEGTAIQLVITPPWWRTLWFRLLCLFVVVIALYSIYYIRTQKLKEIRAIRNRIASDLHDDLGATLSSISIMSELVNQQVKDRSPESSLLLEKIGSSSRNMIESVNDMVWAINPRNDNFENIIKRMRSFASEILGAKDIAFHFDFDRNLLQSKLKMDMRRNFYLIFKEAVNNIAKYSCANNVFVMLWNKENNLKITIRDDGNGFDANSALEGNGLTNMQHRAALMKAKFNLESIPGKGTIVELEFKNE
jgi:ligand-binding sensor domain-containing protein/two-component sensor histidine kinase